MIIDFCQHVLHFGVSIPVPWCIAVDCKVIAQHQSRCIVSRKSTDYVFLMGAPLRPTSSAQRFSFAIKAAYFKQSSGFDQPPRAESLHLRLTPCYLSSGGMAKHTKGNIVRRCNYRGRLLHFHVGEWLVVCYDSSGLQFRITVSALFSLILSFPVVVLLAEGCSGRGLSAIITMGSCIWLLIIPFASFSSSTCKFLAIDSQKASGRCSRIQAITFSRHSSVCSKTRVLFRMMA